MKLEKLTTEQSDYDRLKLKVKIHVATATEPRRTQAEFNDSLRDLVAEVEDEDARG